MTESSHARSRQVTLRRACIALVMVVLILIAHLRWANPSAAAVDRAPVQSASWAWPIAPPRAILGPYRAPATPYSSGHRGIDVGSTAGDFVVAPADGLVHFTGTVVDRAVLTIVVDDGVLASFEPVEALVAKGEGVARGQIVGIVRSGGHCSDECIHFGVRVGGEYVSPLLFLGGVPRAVLLPLHG